PWHVKAPPRDHAPPVRLAAVFATRRTVEAATYRREIARRAPATNVVQIACPDLAARIEAGADDDELAAMVRTFAARLRTRLNGAIPDATILGCTHYPLVAEHFAAALPPGARILSQPDVVATALARYLARHPEFAAGPSARSGAVDVAFYTTGDTARIDPLATRFFGRPVRFTHLSHVPAERRAAG
ncbi:MAG: glutamate racemase, partial [Alphaproteobacteria bacterium]